MNTSFTLQAVDPAQAASLIESAGCITLSFLTLLVYDHLTNLDKEITLVWGAHWGTTKVLYVLNRIFPVLGAIFQLLATFGQNLSPDACHATGLLTRLFGGFEFAVIGGVLSIRVYHLWAHRRAVQGLIAVVFLAAMIAAILPAINRKKPLVQTHLGCLLDATSSGSPDDEWKVMLPILVLQTFLFCLTFLRVHFPTSRGYSPARKRTPLMRRIVLDGSLFYVVVLCCISFVLAIRLSNNPMLIVPLFMSNFVTPALSISVSHLILSIRSLAASLVSNPTFLLNNVELTRLQHGRRFRDGAEGELIVDVEASVTDLDFEIDEQKKKNRVIPVVTSTRVGVFEWDYQ